jgi:inorganic triphosphatase YgiF
MSVSANRQEALRALPGDLEIELKLGLGARAAKALFTHPLILESAPAGPEQHRLDTTYYDTPDLDLFHGGHFLRVRRDSDRFVQALKSRGAGLAGLEFRRESECRLDDEKPRPDLIVDPPACLKNAKFVGALRPTVRTAFSRTAWMIETDGGGRVELAFDRGHILAGKHRLPLCEVELELKRGATATIFDVALDLGETVSMRIGDESKAVRGFRAIEGTPHGWSKAAKIVHGDFDTADEAFVRIVRTCLDQISANQAGAMAGTHPEGVHQTRVGIRRLRSALAVFSKLVGDGACASIRTELRWLAGQLGPARDIDVFRDEILAPVAEYFGADPSVACLQTLIEKRTETDYRRVRRALRSSRCLRLMLTMGRWLDRRAWRADASSSAIARLDNPVADFAARVLRKGHRRLRGVGGSLESMPEDDLHRLRIDIKKQRYAVEYFGNIFSVNVVERYLRALKDLQDELGALNDTAVAQRILSDLIDTLPSSGARRRDALRGAALVTGWHARAVVEHRATLQASWRKWRRCKPFWT